jgi:hypothetical protein
MQLPDFPFCILTTILPTILLSKRLITGTLDDAFQTKRILATE